MQNLAQAPVNAHCPVCGLPVDERIPVVVGLLPDDEVGDQVVRIGTCGAEHRGIAACRSAMAARAALEDGTMPMAFEDA